MQAAVMFRYEAKHHREDNKRDGALLLAGEDEQAKLRSQVHRA